MSSTNGLNSPEEVRSDGEDHDDNDNDHENDTEPSEKSAPKIKLFFKNLMGSFKKGKGTSSNPNLSKQDGGRIHGANKSECISSHDSYVLEAPVESSPRGGGVAGDFWSLDPVKNEAACDEYRRSAHFVSSPRAFRDLFEKSIDSGDFKEIGEFFNWMFSNSSNMIELFISEKTNLLLSNENRHHHHRHGDACHHVSMNWRFLKELYNCLVKMVICKFLLISSFEYIIILKFLFLLLKTIFSFL